MRELEQQDEQQSTATPIAKFIGLFIFIIDLEKKVSDMGQLLLKTVY
tara:strand:- start:143 stop:283 length:141 start_codon:yes stop_codon:yes gene_type:complete